tara:strand:+ start:1210 stop:1377 length:168 start_codon:yes stop_codon:yes gene_type:complete
LSRRALRLYAQKVKQFTFKGLAAKFGDHESGFVIFCIIFRQFRRFQYLGAKMGVL